MGPEATAHSGFPGPRCKAIGVDVRVDLIADGTAARAWEEWLRDNVVRRMPGAK